MFVFALFFSVFVYYRAHNLDVYLESRKTLNQNIGALNTLWLLTSSWFVVVGVRAARNDISRPRPQWFALAFLCGLGFVFDKVYEYHEKLAGGITLETNEFYMYYYVFTGIHLLHVLIGMIVLIYMWRLTGSELKGKHDLAVLESGASFWHLVDLLWIILFPLLYLMR